MIEAVIWDVDGTLVSTKDLYLECYRRALAPHLGRMLTDEDLLAMRPHSELQVLRSGAGDAYEQCMRDFARHYAELHTSHFGGIYDGVLEVLENLRARGIRNGIVTGKSRSSWEITLAHAALGDFDVVIVDDDVSNPKPHPEGIIAAIESLGVEPPNCIYVGDSPTDMEAARAAGTAAAAALWSKSEVWRARFLDRVAAMPDILLLEAPGELLQYLPNGEFMRADDLES